MKRLRIIFIKNYRAKIIFALAALAFWMLMFFTASYFSQVNQDMDAIATKPTEYLKYESAEGGFSFSYPSGFSISPKSFPGGDILSHVDIHDSKSQGYGFVQIWNMTVPVKDFLEKSRETSKLEYKYFNSRRMRVGGFYGYYWDYSVLSGNNTYYKGSEVFLEGKNKMYRISYFLPETLWNDEQNEIFTNMVKSFRKH